MSEGNEKPIPKTLGFVWFADREIADGFPLARPIHALSEHNNTVFVEFYTDKDDALWLCKKPMDIDATVVFANGIELPVDMELFALSPVKNAPNHWTKYHVAATVTVNAMKIFTRERQTNDSE